jgi:hypothetical protein
LKLPASKIEQSEIKFESMDAASAVRRNVGSTPSERYLAKLCEKSFLALWSYPNVYIDKRTGGKGNGKELCDLLVVCGDHILIFSDKSIAWPTSETDLAWRRWYKRAIKNSADQVRGAERWLSDFPDRVYLDRECLKPFPLKLPPKERRKIHGIVVALGANESCKDYFGGDVGSMMIDPSIKGDQHWKAEAVRPFVIGDVNPSGTFMHVFDNFSLDVVMSELDTITDFTTYLRNKERLIRSKQLLSAGGEEDLVSYYMTHMNRSGEHDFTNDDKSEFRENQFISIQDGNYQALKQRPQYLAKKSLDLDSYAWDKLVGYFVSHLLAGSSVIPRSSKRTLIELESGIRHMALVTRNNRRGFGRAFLDALEIGRGHDRFTRAMVFQSGELQSETGFFFMTLAYPKIDLPDGYEQYRSKRLNMLEAYAYSYLKQFDHLKRIIGIGMEPPNSNKHVGTSEDLVYLEAPEWTPQLLANLEERKQLYDIGKVGNSFEKRIQINEFPETDTANTEVRFTGLNRKERRLHASKKRRSRI